MCVPCILEGLLPALECRSEFLYRFRVRGWALLVAFLIRHCLVDLHLGVLLLLLVPIDPPRFFLCQESAHVRWYLDVLVLGSVVAIIDGRCSCSFLHNAVAVCSPTIAVRMKATVSAKSASPTLHFFIAMPWVPSEVRNWFCNTKLHCKHLHSVCDVLQLHYIALHCIALCCF